MTTNLLLSSQIPRQPPHLLPTKEQTKMASTVLAKGQQNVADYIETVWTMGVSNLPITGNHIIIPMDVYHAIGTRGVMVLTDRLW